MLVNDTMPHIFRTITHASQQETNTHTPTFQYSSYIRTTFFTIHNATKIQRYKNCNNYHLVGDQSYHRIHITCSHNNYHQNTNIFYQSDIALFASYNNIQFIFSLQFVHCALKTLNKLSELQIPQFHQKTQ